MGRWGTLRPCFVPLDVPDPAVQNIVASNRSARTRTRTWTPDGMGIVRSVLRSPVVLHIYLLSQLFPLCCYLSLPCLIEPFVPPMVSCSSVLVYVDLATAVVLLGMYSDTYVRLHMSVPCFLLVLCRRARPCVPTMLPNCICLVVFISFHNVYLCEKSTIQRR